MLLNMLHIFFYSSRSIDEGFHIVDVNPSVISSAKRTNVVFHVYPNVTGYCYCKFGSIVISGHADNSGQVICKSPSYPPGQVQVFFSKDRIKWSNSVEITFSSHYSINPVMLAVPFGVFVFIGALISTTKIVHFPYVLLIKRNLAYLIDNVITPLVINMLETLVPYINKQLKFIQNYF